MLFSTMLAGGSLWALQKVRSLFSGEEPPSLGTSLLHAWGMLLEDPPSSTPTNTSGQVGVCKLLRVCVFVCVSFIMCYSYLLGFLKNFIYSFFFHFHLIFFLFLDVFLFSFLFLFELVLNIFSLICFVFSFDKFFFNLFYCLHLFELIRLRSPPPCSSISSHSFVFFSFLFFSFFIF